MAIGIIIIMLGILPDHLEGEGITVQIPDIELQIKTVDRLAFQLAAAGRGIDIGSCVDGHVILIQGFILEKTIAAFLPVKPWILVMYHGDT